MVPNAGPATTAPGKGEATMPAFDDQDTAGEERAVFERDRWVRVMCDHSAEGVWHRDGSAPPVSALPVPETLQARILAWQRTFEESARDDGSVAAPGFGAEGLAIAREVKRHLPGWTVVYFDEDAYARVRGKAAPGDRGAYEYEV
jgi:hypothetical protein